MVEALLAAALLAAPDWLARLRDCLRLFLARLGVFDCHRSAASKARQPCAIPTPPPKHPCTTPIPKYNNNPLCVHPQPSVVSGDAGPLLKPTAAGTAADPDKAQSDPMMVLSKGFPCRPVTVRAIRAHRDDHLPD